MLGECPGQAFPQPQHLVPLGPHVRCGGAEGWQLPAEPWDSPRASSALGERCQARAGLGALGNPRWLGAAPWGGDGCGAAAGGSPRAPASSWLGTRLLAAQPSRSFSVLGSRSREGCGGQGGSAAPAASLRLATSLRHHLASGKALSSPHQGFATVLSARSRPSPGFCQSPQGCLMGWSPQGFAEKFLYPLLDASTASSVEISCIMLCAFNLLALASPAAAGLVTVESNPALRWPK